MTSLKLGCILLLRNYFPDNMKSANTVMTLHGELKTNIIIITRVRVYVEIYCIALHCIALHCIALHCIVLYDIIDDYRASAAI